LKTLVKALGVTFDVCGHQFTQAEDDVDLFEKMVRDLMAAWWGVRLPATKAPCDAWEFWSRTARGARHQGATEAP